MEIKQYPIGHSDIKNFVQDHSCSIFDSPSWLSVLKDNFGNAEVSYYCLLDNGKILACLGITVLDFKFIKIAQSNFPYGGFMGSKEYFPIFTELLLKELSNRSIHLLKIVKTSWNDFEGLKGFSPIKDYQHILNLNGLSKDSVWQNYKKRVRRDVRRAEKLNIKILKIENRAEIEVFGRLYRETMMRNKAYPHMNKNSLYSIYDNLCMQGNAEIFFAKLNEDYIGSMLLLYFKKVCYYFLSASATKFLSYSPNDLLVYTGINFAIEKKADFFDFMTTPFHNKQLMNFKEKWGPDSSFIYTYEKLLNPARAKIWHLVYKFINSAPGSLMLRAVRK